MNVVTILVPKCRKLWVRENILVSPAERFEFLKLIKTFDMINRILVQVQRTQAWHVGYVYCNQFIAGDIQSFEGRQRSRGELQFLKWIIT